MSRIVVLEILSVQLFLMGCIACPAFAQDARVTVVQPAQVVVQPQPVVVQPAPVVVQPAPVVVQPAPTAVQPQVVTVQPQTVVVQPYPVLEGSDSIPIDPEDYYYQDKDIYYHHTYQSDKDVVVTVVPTEYRFVHGRIDVSKIPQKHFRHPPQRPGTTPREVEKTETTTTQVNPAAGTASVEKETTTTVKR